MEEIIICKCCNLCKVKLIFNIKLELINEINLNNTLNIYYCESCNFYYSLSGNNQNDYNNYYMVFNNYKKEILYSDKNERCYMYLKEKLKNKNIKNILDYGSGNCKIKNLLLDTYNVDNYDIGMKKNISKYDCLLLSHVLEHIYDINEFIHEISLNIKDDNGLLYIEVPNAEYYDEMIDICPLQEINIEHINFFSKYSLNKLLTKHNFITISLEDDYFMIKENKYYIIRAIFQKNKINNSFYKYIENGNKIIKNYNFDFLKKYLNIYIYGCGQFLFKIFNNISYNTNIINIIDDNPCLLNKMLNNIKIINLEFYKEKAKNDDVILLTSLINDNILKKNIENINKNVIILKLDELT